MPNIKNPNNDFDFNPNSNRILNEAISNWKDLGLLPVTCNQNNKLLCK